MRPASAVGCATQAVPPILHSACLSQPSPTASAFVAVACSGSAYAGASHALYRPSTRCSLLAPRCTQPLPQVWAYANIGVNPGEELLQDFARAAIQRMPEFRWGPTKPRVLLH